MTSFTYDTLPVDKLWFAANLYTSNKNQQLLNALVEYQQIADRDAKAHIVYQLSEDTRAAGSFVGFFYMDPVEWPSVFELFHNITPTANMINSSIGTLSELVSRYYNPQYPDAGGPPLRYARYLTLLLHSFVGELTIKSEITSFLYHRDLKMRHIKRVMQPLSLTHSEP